MKQYSIQPVEGATKGPRKEGVGEGLAERVGKGLAKGWRKGWRRVGEGLAKGWQRVGEFPRTLQYCNFRSARLEEGVCDSMGNRPKKPFVMKCLVS